MAALIWNGTLDQSEAAGSDVLGRRAVLRFAGLLDGEYELYHRRVGDDRSCAGGRAAHRR